MENKVCLNGKFIAPGDALIPALDYGFLYGYGLFETMRAYNGIVFRIDRHMDRLLEGAVVLEMNSALDLKEIKKLCRELLEVNNLKEARIRVAVTAGLGSIPPDLSPCASPTLFITAYNYIPPAEQVYKSGYKAVISAFSRSSKSRLSGLKTICYLENMLARREALKQKADEALMINESGMVSEGSISNIFIVSGGKVTTPALSEGALPGITREAVIELCGSMGVECIEGQLSPEILTKADEAFLTGSVLEIMPLVDVSGRPVGTGKPGLLTEKLIKAYTELVQCETMNK